MSDTDHPAVGEVRYEVFVDTDRAMPWLGRLRLKSLAAAEGR